MKKPASVHIDIAEFSMIVMEIPATERGEWLESFVECLALNKPEPVIEPIKFDDPVPEYVYKVSDSSIKIRKVLRFRRIDEKEADGTRKTLEYIQTNNGDYDFNKCYKTLDEAVAVARAKWSVK